MRLISLLFASALVVSATLPPPRAAVPHRIVSLDLCTDQLLVALADRSQIAAVTTLARDPAMSAIAATAARLPVTRAGAENLIALQADLILASPWGGSAALAALGRTAPPVVDLPSAESYDAIVAQIRIIAAAVGHPHRGETLIARMNDRLARVQRLERPLVAADYQRRGYLTGADTLTDALMTRVGLVNLARQLRRPPLSQLSLEALVAARPDYIIVDTATDRVADQGSELLHHPILASIPRLRLPGAWTTCGGPAFVLAAESLAAQLRARRQSVTRTPPIAVLPSPR